MNRRIFLGSALALTAGVPRSLAREPLWWDESQAILERATANKQVDSAVLHVVRNNKSYSQHFGQAKSADAMFLLGSISKPINMAALMTLYDQGKFALDDRVKKFLPRFAGEGRDRVTIRHLLTHTSGLPDQLPNNNELRQKHAPLMAFIDDTIRTPLAFVPGSRYSYSSMGILLAAHIAETISGTDILTLVDRTVFQPLKMQHSAQGLGRFRLDQLVPCQMEGAAPESGAGDPTAKEWNWNSLYWRKLGAPWGTTHASAPDLGRFLAEFLEERGQILKPATARLMVTNHNREGLTSRGLGFAVGRSVGSAGCSERTFGHTGSTGTLCWADPDNKTICIVLTSLPSRGAKIHPRQLVGDRVAAG